MDVSNEIKIITTGNAERCAKQASKKAYSRKKGFKGNQFYYADGTPKPKKVVNDPVVVADGANTSSGNVVAEEDLNSTISAKKIVDVDADVDDNNTDSYLQGYRLIDLSILKEIIELFCCPVCKHDGHVSIVENKSKRKGLASFLEIKCINCNFEFKSYTSKGIEGNLQAMEVNYRSVYAMRRCGGGQKALQKFCGVMNMPPPVARKSYKNILTKLGVASEKVAKCSMVQAAVDTKENGETDIGVSFDGTWQKRGYSSLNGVGAAISVSTGKVIDVETLSRHCKNCLEHQSLKEENPVEYESWLADHEENCQLNHDGSAGSMEKAAAIKIFSRSIDNYGLRYTKFYGDGDSSSFQAVENVYSDVSIKKFECLGHYQKRVGHRLRNLRTRVKGLGGKGKTKVITHKTIDGKILKITKKAKGKLTDSMINLLQNYFGIALRSGAKTVSELKKSLLASLFHVASSEEGNYHTYCPATADSWCQYQADQINGTNNHKPGKGLEYEVINQVKGEYEKLTDEKELAKCLHGLTQNANESFNSLIWERAPKSRYCSLSTLEICVYDAVSYFNYGAKSVIDTLKLLHIDAGKFTKLMASDANITRMYNAAYKDKDSSKLRRKIIRGLKKKKSDNLRNKEGVTYEAGGF